MKLCTSLKPGLRCRGVLAMFFIVLVQLLNGQSTTLTNSINCNFVWEKTFGWTIEKTASSASLDLFTGDTKDVTYTIDVQKDNGTHEAWMEGEICVTNGGGSATQDLTIVLTIKNGVPPPNDVVATVTLDLSAKPILPAGESYCYAFKVDMTNYLLTHKDISGWVGTFKTSASVSITNRSGGNPTNPYNTGNCDETAPSSPTLINDNITVEDSNGDSWGFSDDGSESYATTYSCDDEGENENTATIKETGASSSASVEVNCYELTVTKTATTSLTRTHAWSIEKTADVSSLTLSTGQIYQYVNYEVTLGSTSSDSDWAASGEITISNPAPMAATLTGVSDLISGGITASVSCPTLEVPAGGSIICTYSANLPDASDRSNTATATLQNYATDADGISSTNGTTNFTGTADVSFASANVTHVDEEVSVSDDQYGDLGTLNFSDASKKFTYRLAVGGYAVCGDYSFNNTAAFTTNDQELTGSDSWTVVISVPCGGCTLTQGYWKTHSSFGPAPYDSDWAGRENSSFFGSGQTWYQVLWTTPASGDVYYVLAHQYQAARLNIINGAASTPAVEQALKWADDNSVYGFFNKWNPKTVSKSNKSIRNQAIAHALTLESYNSGMIGPGHCEEDASSGGFAPNAPDLSSIKVVLPESKEVYKLEQNAPNPFSGKTSFNFTLPQPTQLSLTIYSLTGQLIATVANGKFEAGDHTINWQSPGNLAAGVYFYKLETSDFTSMKKMIVQK